MKGRRNLKGNRMKGRRNWNEEVEGIVQVLLFDYIHC